MNDPQPIDIRRRIRELLSIPDRDRTDAEWDELNELEIRTAPGNRDNGLPMDRTDSKRQGAFGQGRRQQQNPNHGKKNNNGPRAEQRQPLPDNRPDGGQRADRPDGQNRPPKRQHRRPKRPMMGEQGQPNQGQPQSQPPVQPSPPPSSSGPSQGNPESGS